jgi:two-component system, NarL family, response regulator DevR
MNEIRVGIVDDHSVVRQGLAALLDRQPGMRVVGDAASASAALAMVAQARPHVVLLDLKLSADRDGDGLRVCAAVTERFPQSRVLVLTTFADEWMILEAIKQGAHGYLLKDVEIGELVRAIRAVRRGESTLDPRSASAVVQWMQGSRTHGGGGPASTARGRRRTAPAQQITPREREILALLARGMSNGAIGQRLYISGATVKFHVGNVMRKLGASRRAEAVYAASKMGLI